MVYRIRAGLHVERGHIPQQHRRAAPFVARSIEAVREIEIAPGEGRVLQRDNRAAAPCRPEWGGGVQRCARADDRNIQQVFRLCQRLFRILRQQEVAVGRLGVEPVIGAERDVRTDAGDDVHNHAILPDAVIGRFGPVHVHVQLRIALSLLDAHVGRVGDLRDFSPDFFRDRANDLQIGSFHLNVDRGAQAEVQHVADDASGLKTDFHAGKGLADFGA